MIRKVLLCCLALFLGHLSSLSAQDDRFVDLEKRLTALSQEVPELNNRTELSVSGVSIQEFVRGIAISNGLNISIDPSIKINVVNNFSNARVADVFVNNII